VPQRDPTCARKYRCTIFAAVHHFVLLPHHAHVFFAPHLIFASRTWFVAFPPSSPLCAWLWWGVAARAGDFGARHAEQRPGAHRHEQQRRGLPAAADARRRGVGGPPGTLQTPFRRRGLRGLHGLRRQRRRHRRGMGRWGWGRGAHGSLWWHPDAWRRSGLCAQLQAARAPELTAVNTHRPLAPAMGPAGLGSGSWLLPSLQVRLLSALPGGSSGPVSILAKRSSKYRRSSNKQQSLQVHHPTQAPPGN